MVNGAPLCKKVTNVTWAFPSMLSWTELTVPWNVETLPKVARTKTFPQAVAYRRTKATRTVIERPDTASPAYESLHLADLA
jgi:hypothetical protein